jgi:hypothetical protein
VKEIETLDGLDQFNKIEKLEDEEWTKESLIRDIENRSHEAIFDLMKDRYKHTYQ